MAKVSFTTGEGGEKSYKLVSHRPVRIGRDPSNDIILRDAKVSRSHAEIVFERGFFVLHDLASANGTYVNGAKVRVAPLTDGAQLKLGNSHGFFSEELPDSPQQTLSADQKSLQNAPDVDDAAGDADQHMPTLSPDGENAERIGTAPLPLGHSTSQSMAEAIASSSPPAPAPDRIPIVVAQIPRFAPQPTPLKGVEVDSYTAGERLTVRDESGGTLYYFRRPAALISLMVTLLGGIVFLTGAAVSFFLLAEKIVLPSLLAAMVTLIFTLLIVGLSPRRTLSLYDDEQMSARSMMIRQDAAFPFPRIYFRAQDTSGKTIGLYDRNRVAPLMRRTWRIRDSAGTAVGMAREKKWSTVLLRFLSANFASSTRPQYNVRLDNNDAASLDRNGDAVRLVVHSPAVTRFDPRMPIALTVIVAALDR